MDKIDIYIDTSDSVFLTLHRHCFMSTQFQARSSFYQRHSSLHFVMVTFLFVVVFSVVYSNPTHFDECLIFHLFDRISYVYLIYSILVVIFVLIPINNRIG